jgi:hypothetical protein
LWAHKNDSLDPSPTNLYSQHLRNQGYQVEKLAKEYLKRKVKTQYPQASISFQTTFIDGEFQSRIDALVHDEIYDTYDLYEIKSSTSIKKEHEYDVTFQYLVGQTQINIHKIYLVRVNSSYVKNGDLDLEQLFIVDDMMDVVAKRKDAVLAGREEALEVLKLSEAPTHLHCFKPKTCHCKSLCHPNLGEYPIYDLQRGTQKQYAYLLDLGCSSLVDIPDDFSLNPFQELQRQSARQNKPLINKDTIAQELAQLQYPLYFLDYETFGTAIPIYDGYAPYQNIVFQYSLHVIDSEGAEPKHHEYLVTDTDEPSANVVKRLLSVIGETGTIIVWNKHFECGRNRELGKLQPDYCSQLESINQRTYDLIDPFRKGYYVDYRFHGSNSIKDVLPVLVPELSYKDLDIAEGTAAMINWFKITHDANSAFDEDSIHLKDKIKQDLLKYCELDTFAMVRIWEKLNEIISRE